MKWNIVIGSLVLGLGLSTQSFGFDLLDRMLGMDYDGCGKGGACGKVDPCCQKGDPGCLQKGDPCCQKGDPKCGGCKSCTPLLDKIRCHLAASPCQKGGDCCGKMEDPCCQKGDPCVQKGDPCCQKGDPCVQKGEGKCGKSCTPLLDRIRCRMASLRSCNKCGKGDCCGKMEDPCCQKGDPCIQKGDPCCQKGEGKCGKSRGSLLDRIFSCRACQKGKACGKGEDCGCGMDFAPAPEAPEAGAPEAAPTPPAPVVDPSAFLPTKRRFIQTTLVR
jgi:hypothetical protein